MQPDAHEALWLDPGERLTMAQLAESCGSTEAYLHELIDYGVLLPANPGELQAAFSVDCLFRVRKASRLRDDLELDIHALALLGVVEPELPPTQAQIDFEAAQAKAITDATAAKADNKLAALGNMSPAQVRAWVGANVTNLADAKDVLATLAVAVSVLARKI